MVLLLSDSTSRYKNCTVLSLKITIAVFIIKKEVRVTVIHLCTKRHKQVSSIVTYFCTKEAELVSLTVIMF